MAKVAYGYECPGITIKSLILSAELAAIGARSTLNRPDRVAFVLELARGCPALARRTEKLVKRRCEIALPEWQEVFDRHRWRGRKR